MAGWRHHTKAWLHRAGHLVRQRRSGLGRRKARGLTRQVGMRRKTGCGMEGDTSSDEVNGTSIPFRCSTIWQRKDREERAAGHIANIPATSWTTTGTRDMDASHALGPLGPRYLLRPYGFVSAASTAWKRRLTCRRRRADRRPKYRRVLSSLEMALPHLHGAAEADFSARTWCSVD